MGWIGAGVLIVSISYLLYKYLPAKWNSFQEQVLPCTPPPVDAPEAAKNQRHVTARFISEEQPVKRPPEDGIFDTSAVATKQNGAVVQAYESRDIDAERQSGRTLSRRKSETTTVPSVSNPPILNLNGDKTFLDGDDVLDDASLHTPALARTSHGSTTTALQNRQRLGPPSFPASMHAPPRPSPNVPFRAPKPSAATALRIPPTFSASLHPSGTSTSSAQNNALFPKPSRLVKQLGHQPLIPQQQKPSRRVILQPGHSPLDWAALASNPRHNLRGANLPHHLIRVTPTMLKAHNGRKGSDAWTSYLGKVYNITPFLPFHPGGPGELLRGAGKDSEKLFMEEHPWVNWDGMLGECLVGILVGENEPLAKPGAGEGGLEGSLDEMD